MGEKISVLLYDRDSGESKRLIITREQDKLLDYLYNNTWLRYDVDTIYDEKDIMDLT